MVYDAAACLSVQARQDVRESFSVPPWAGKMVQGVKGPDAKPEDF